MKGQPNRNRKPGLAGFSVVEAIVGIGVVGTVFVALYSGIASGFINLQMARENMRATQIIMEKMEHLRLFTWEQITDSSFPTDFTASFSPPIDGITQSSTGPTYTGTVTVEDVPFSTNYSSEMKQITVQLAWTTGNVPRQRSLTTFVTRNGIQSYLY